MRLDSIFRAQVTPALVDWLKEREKRAAVWVDSCKKELETNDTVQVLTCKYWDKYELLTVSLRLVFAQESIIGSTFNVSVIEESKIGSLDAVIPEVVGSANIVGRNTFWVDR